MKSNRSLVKILFYILVIIAPFSLILPQFFPTGVFSILRDGIVILLSFLFLLRLVRMKFINISLFEFILFLFIIYGFFHIFISLVDLPTSLMKFRVIYFYPILALLAILYFKNLKVEGKNEVSLFIKIFIFQGFLMTVFAILEIIFGDSLLMLLYQERFFDIPRNLLGQNGIRVVSLMYNPIILGIFMNIFLVFLLYSGKNNFIISRNVTLVLKLILIPLNIVITFLTYSRISVIIAILIFIAYILLNYKWLFKLKNAVITIFLVLLLITSTQYLVDFQGDNLTKRYGNITTDTFKENARIENWNEYLQGIYSKGNIHILWGGGLGTSNSSNKEQTEIIKKVENSYVTYLGETGIIGFLLFIFILLRFLVLIFRKFDNNKEQAKIILQVLLVLIIASFSNDTFHNNPFSFYFWILYFYTEITNPRQINRR